MPIPEPEMKKVPSKKERKNSRKESIIEEQLDTAADEVELKAADE